MPYPKVRGETVEDLYWHYAHICAHGVTCLWCCWPWQGFFEKGLPVIRMRRERFIAACAMQVGYRLIYRTGAPGVGFRLSCTTHGCVNPHHGHTFTTERYWSLLACPFPITAWATQAYGEAFITFFLRQVQVCSCWRKAGWLCPNCCFLYRGYTNVSRGWSAIPNMLTKLFRRDHPAIPWQVSIPTFSWSLWHPPSDITSSCSNTLCANVQHMEPNESTALFDPWNYRGICDHGPDCTACCWSWEGPQTHVTMHWDDGSVSTIDIRHSGDKMLATILWLWDHGAPRHLHYEIRAHLTCTTPWCSNPAHIQAVAPESIPMTGGNRALFERKRQYERHRYRARTQSHH